MLDEKRISKGIETNAVHLTANSFESQKDLDKRLENPFAEIKIFLFSHFCFF
ncbi:hypothetical protein ABIB40_001027 [Pedobacter sp. UYP30]